jgi:hypothetical protein
MGLVPAHQKLFLLLLLIRHLKGLLLLPLFPTLIIFPGIKLISIG